MWSYFENTKSTYKDILFFYKEQHIEGAAIFFAYYWYLRSPICSTLSRRLRETNDVFMWESWLNQERGQSESREDGDTKQTWPH